jgi:amino acid transporter
MAVSVIGATLLYALVQLVAAGILPSIGRSERPLVDVAIAVAGSGAGQLVAFVATLSALGFCSGSAMVVPRYVETFAQDGFLPALLHRRWARFGTPAVSIVAVSLVVAALASWLDFTALSDVSNVAVVVQYQSTAIAILVWRRRDPNGASGFRLPLGPLIPVAALVGTFFFLVQVSAVELAFGGVLLAMGLGLGYVTRLLRGVPMK